MGSYTVSGCDCCKDDCVAAGCGCRNTKSKANVGDISQVTTVLSPNDGGECFDCGGDKVSSSTVTIGGGTGDWTGGGWSYKGTVDVKDDSGNSVAGYPLTGVDISVSGGCGSWTVSGGGQSASFGPDNSTHSGTKGGQSLQCVGGPSPNTCTSIVTSGSISISPDDCCSVGGTCYKRQGRDEDGRCPFCCSCLGCWLDTLKMKFSWDLTDNTGSQTDAYPRDADEESYQHGDLTLYLETPCTDDGGNFTAPNPGGDPLIVNPEFSNRKDLSDCPQGTYNGSGYDYHHYQGLTAVMTYNCVFTPWPGLWEVRVWNLADCDRNYGIDSPEDDAPGFGIGFFGDGYGYRTTGYYQRAEMSDPNYYTDEIAGDLCGFDLQDVEDWKAGDYGDPSRTRWKGNFKLEIQENDCCRQPNPGDMSGGACLQGLGQPSCDTVDGSKCQEESPAP